MPQKWSREPLRSGDGQYPKLYFIEGEHFQMSNPRKAIYRLISRELGSMAVDCSSLLVAGYDSANDNSKNPPRDSTYAVEFKHFKHDMKSLWRPRNIIDTLAFTGLIEGLWYPSREPAVGFYKNSMLLAKPSEPFFYLAPEGSCVNDAKIAEFHLIRKGETWRLPEVS